MTALTLGAFLFAALALGFSLGVALGLSVARTWRRAAERWESAYNLGARSAERWESAYHLARRGRDDAQ